ncbi:tripartite motif-containing protein 16-like [Gymnodraco acuticeps]|uniref:Tripartite motif-containing protein 16-like n=1 Tax=Gymnodraco acuticeps TaxID=8218 RepID=A0A6P8U619_GYMAC|nr:tripartite motif-containing protein 16-like [Gymnodraco acuticeps]
MAEGIHLDRAHFCCSICLDLLKDPVTFSCGHNYCMVCITDHLDTQDDGMIYTCPQCRQKFMQRPALVKNNMLAFVVGELMKIETPTPPPPSPDDHSSDQTEHVACDFCEEKAIKSCLQCMVSYCVEHLRPHFEVAPLQKHKLVEASAQLQENICPRHQEVMKLFCRTDQQCICYLCSKDTHKGHNKVSTAAERVEKQRELQVTLQNIRKTIQDKQKDAKWFQQEEDTINRCAEAALRNNENTYKELMHIIEKSVAEVKEKVTSRQETEVRWYKKVREKLEQDVAELKRKDEELKKFSHTEDHTGFLIKYPTLVSLSESTDPPPVKAHRVGYFEKVSMALSEAKVNLHAIVGEEYAKVSMTVTGVIASNTKEEPITRADFLHYVCQVTLDPNTANTHLKISGNEKMVTFVSDEQKYPLHPERFVYSWQLLSKDSLDGRSYWEVELSGTAAFVAVAYKDISRLGGFTESMFGYNDKSWALDCYKNTCTFRHDNVRTRIPGMWSSRVGVYLDPDAGVLSFYSVSETRTLVHRVQTKFTQPLYAGLWLSDGVSAEVCRIR